MCLPAAAAALAATAVTAIGTGVSALSSAAQQRYQGRVADVNARMESRAEQDALERGRAESRNYRREASQRMGQQRAALAANGVDLDFGSAAQIRADMADAAGEDAQTIRENATREASGFQINALNYRTSAQAARMAGRGALVSGAFNFGSTVLGGASQYRQIKARGYR